MIRFSVAKNKTTGDFEVVCHRGKRTIVVATNLRTRYHAAAALRFWRDMTDGREGEHEEL